VLRVSPFPARFTERTTTPMPTTRTGARTSSLHCRARIRREPGLCRPQVDENSYCCFCAPVTVSRTGDRFRNVGPADQKQNVPTRASHAPDSPGQAVPALRALRRHRRANLAVSSVGTPRYDGACSRAPIREPASPQDTRSNDVIPCPGPSL
jgi:hypothetical protein